MPNWLRRLTTAPIFAGDEDRTRLAAQLNVILWSFAAIVVIVGIVAPFLFAGQVLPIMAVLGILIVLTVGMMLLMHGGQVRLAAGLFSLGMWGLYALLIVGTGGLTSPAALTWIVVVTIAGLLLGQRAAFAFAGLGAVGGLAVLYAQLNGLLPPPFITFSAVGGWSMLAAHLGITSMLLYLATRSVGDALGRARLTAAELAQQRDRLETVVEARTRELARRSNYLEATAQVGRQMAATLELNVLLPRVVALVGQQFGFYHVALYLIDAAGHWAELRAASSAGGERMLEQGFRVATGAPGAVSTAAFQGRAYLVRDAATDTVFEHHPDLKDTRSEIALPLQSKGQVIGVLDVQSVEPQAFVDEDVAVLQTLADQIALAIDNARLFAQTQASLEAERRAYGELSQQAWAAMLRTGADLGFVRDERGIFPASGSWEAHMIEAIHRGETTTAGPDGTTVALPIQVRDQIIGVINVERSTGMGPWNREQLEMLHTLSEQLGLALDSARLYQDSQRRAARERLATEVTGRVRASLDVEAVLKTTADELYQALDLEEVVVRLISDRAAATLSPYR